MQLLLLLLSLLLLVPEASAPFQFGGQPRVKTLVTAVAG
jgi:hypothetical protein